MFLLAFTCNPKRVSVTTLSKRTTVTQDTIQDFLKNTGKRFPSLKNDLVRLASLQLMWDNARPHLVRRTEHFFTLRGLETVKPSL